MPLNGLERPNYERLPSLGDHDSSQSDAVELKPLKSSPHQYRIVSGDEEDVKELNEPTRRNPRKWWSLSGWRVGAATSMSTAFLTMVLNVAALGWAMDNSFTARGPLRQLFFGDCQKVASINTYIHLLINLISTILLGGSNYCMQCLVAPMRSDVDAAHAMGKAVDIGVPSLKNLGYISTRRWSLWGLLLMSSLPLHLLFNSVVFAEIGANDYMVMVASPQFDLHNNTARMEPPRRSFDDKAWPTVLGAQDLMRNGTVDRLSNADCIRAYALDLQRDRRNLVIISRNASRPLTNGTVMDYVTLKYTTPESFQPYNPYPWICSDRDAQRLNAFHRSGTSRILRQDNCFQYVDRLVADEKRWAPIRWDADYCLSERVQGRCGLYMNTGIAWTVIVCNVIKILVMGAVAFSSILDEPFCTVGDAVSSFIRTPDPHTRRMCLTTRTDIDIYQATLAARTWHPERPQKWRSDEHLRWHRAPSRGRWFAAMLFFIMCLVTVAGLLGLGMHYFEGDKSISALARMGLGAPHSQTMIKGWAISKLKYEKAVIASILVANTPQLILSMLYFTLNGLCTCMSLAAEWSHFSYDYARRKGAKALRTSRPRGGQ